MFKLLEPMPSPNNTNFERLFVPARREVQLAFDGRRPCSREPLFMPLSGH
jgi:hypothetical protein